MSAAEAEYRVRHQTFWFAACLAVLIIQIAAEYLMGRVPICSCGYVKLWEGGVNTSGNSQHLSDWYTPSHIIHGFLFYGLGHLPIMPFVSGIVVVIFGSLSIWLQNETFIKMKPTIVNALFGVTLLGGLAFGRSLLGYVFNAAFQLDAEGWRKLTIRWGFFFLFLAVLNEVVWRNFSDDFWIAFKVWGTMPITIIFTLAQMPLVLKHSINLETDGEK